MNHVPDPPDQIVREDGTPNGDIHHLIPDRDLVVRLYREMLRIRLVDERLLALHHQGRIGFYNACVGQEAVPAAVGLALSPEDWVFPALRESGVMLVRGFDLKAYVAQAWGNEKDELLGRQLPGFAASKALNQASVSPCAATQLLHAVGTAWAMRLRHDPGVSVGFVGDGGTSTGDFHAAMNFAGLHRVPCVVVCQNNHWALSVPVERQTASTTLASKAQAYGVPSSRVDGNDVIAVYLAVTGAVQRAREGEGPSFVECVTYRMGPGDANDEPGLYRSDLEIEGWTSRDPIERLHQFLEHQTWLDVETDWNLRDSLKKELDQAMAEVESLAPPSADTIFDDVYQSRPWHLDEQRQTLRNSPRRS